MNALKSSPKKLAYMKSYRSPNKRAVHKRWLERNPDYQHGYYMRNREKWVARSIANRAALSPEERKRRFREMTFRRHGITADQYAAVLAEQNGTCYFCDKRPAEERHGVLRIDHDHTKKRGEKGYFRGLLCTGHNTALGKLGDNEAGLLRALLYVRGRDGRT